MSILCFVFALCANFLASLLLRVIKMTYVDTIHISIILALLIFSLRMVFNKSEFFKMHIIYPIRQIG
uniref:Uncharacterized protein n=1 Tax=Rhizophora mucronata TaxID=61149 RepID=A0A2P2N941_RHIMU